MPFWKFFVILLLVQGAYSATQEDSVPLLRVFPPRNEYECEWSIRYFICLKCIRSGKLYAQKIYFYEDGPYRVHGCYSDRSGFEAVK